jgi:hypothetical protein
MVIWNILWPFGIFMAVWYVMLWKFGFGLLRQEKFGNSGMHVHVLKFTYLDCRTCPDADETGANPTTVSYNASAVKIYNAKSFENKFCFLL